METTCTHNLPYPATVVEAAGGHRMCFLPEESAARLQMLRDMVGGDIEVVPLRDNRYLVIDENGKSKVHRPNEFATWLAREAESIADDDYIAGDAVVVSKSALS